MSDDTWTRIGDNEHAQFGKGILTFVRSDNRAPYTVSYDDTDQDRILVATGDAVLTLDVHYKTRSPTGTIAVAGMLTEQDDLFGIGGAAWGELVFSTQPAFHFYGTAVLIRTDTVATDGREELVGG